MNPAFTSFRDSACPDIEIFNRPAYGANLLSIDFSSIVYVKRALRRMVLGITCGYADSSRCQPQGLIGSRAVEKKRPMDCTYSRGTTWCTPYGEEVTGGNGN